MLAFGDVLSGAAEPRDSARRIPHHFTSIGDPSCAAIRAKDLEIEFVRCSGSQCFRNGTLEAFPAFCCIQLCLFNKGGRRQVGIAAPDSAEFLRPSDRIGCWVPLPVANLRHTLSFYELFLPFSQRFFGLRALFSESRQHHKRCRAEYEEELYRKDVVGLTLLDERTPAMYCTPNGQESNHDNRR